MMAMEYHMIRLIKVGQENEAYKETGTSDETCNGMYGSSSNYYRHGRNAPLLQ
jgi:hypothetical protein